MVATSYLATVSTILLSTSISMAVPLYSAVDPRALLDGGDMDLFSRSSSCITLTPQTMPRIPGWSKVLARRDERWGPKGVLNVNHPDYPGKPAIACITVPHVNARWEGQPQCTEEVIDVGGSSNGVDADVSVSKEASRESEVSWTVTKSSEFTIGSEFTVGIGSDEVGKAEAKFSMSTTFKDETTNSTRTVSSSKETVNLSIVNGDGKQCSVKLKVTTCTGRATASIPVVASGYAWFFYDTPTPDKTGQKATKHYHWNINIDKLLSEAERTRTVQLAGTVKTTTRAAYNVECGAQAAAAAGKKSPVSGAKGKTARRGSSRSKTNAKRPAKRVQAAQASKRQKRRR